MDYSTSISTSYADTYDKTSSQLSDKLTSTDFSQASDDELMSVCKDFESYFVEQMLKNYAEVFTESNNGKGLGIAQTLYEQMKRNYSSDL